MGHSAAKRVCGGFTALLALACGETTEPSLDWLQAGTAIAVTVWLDTDYDCSPDLTPPLDEAICQGGTGVVRAAADTVRVGGVLEDGPPTIFGGPGFLAPVEGDWTLCWIRPPTGMPPGCVEHAVADTVRLSLLTICDDYLIGECPPGPDSRLLLMIRFVVSTDTADFIVGILGEGEMDPEGAAGGELFGTPPPGYDGGLLATRLTPQMRFRLDATP